MENVPSRVPDGRLAQLCSQLVHRYMEIEQMSIRSRQELFPQARFRQGRRRAWARSVSWRPDPALDESLGCRARRACRPAWTWKRPTGGYVVERLETVENPATKHVIRMPPPPTPTDLLRLAEWMASFYMAPLA